MIAKNKAKLRLMQQREVTGSDRELTELAKRWKSQKKASQLHHVIKSDKHQNNYYHTDARAPSAEQAKHIRDLLSLFPMTAEVIKQLGLSTDIIAQKVEPIYKGVFPIDPLSSKGETCPVCMDNIDPIAQLCVAHVPDISIALSAPSPYDPTINLLKGGAHQMHLTCLFAWIRQRVQNKETITCPVCRSPHIVRDMVAASLNTTPNELWPNGQDEFWRAIDVVTCEALFSRFELAVDSARVHIAQKFLHMHASKRQKAMQLFKRHLQVARQRWIEIFWVLNIALLVASCASFARSPLGQELALTAQDRDLRH